MQYKSLIKQNILQFIEYKGISKYKFYQETGITRSVLDKNNGLSEDNTAKFIAQYPEVSIIWLITGKGEMLIGEKKETQLNVNEANPANGGFALNPIDGDFGINDPESMDDLEFHNKIHDHYAKMLKGYEVRNSELLIQLRKSSNAIVRLRNEKQLLEKELLKFKKDSSVG